MYDSPLNEIITAPPYSNGEYIELYNAGNNSANLNSWQLKGDGVTETLALDGVIIPAKESFIIAYRHSRSPSFLLSDVFESISTRANNTLYQNKITLKNTKEYVLLYDNDGLMRDSVYYGNETSIKPIADRLIATNLDNTPGHECLSVPRILVEFSENGVAVANHLHWVVATVRPFQTALAYENPKTDFDNTNPPFDLSEGHNYIISTTYINDGKVHYKPFNITMDWVVRCKLCKEG